MNKYIVTFGGIGKFKIAGPSSDIALQEFLQNIKTGIGFKFPTGENSWIFVPPHALGAIHIEDTGEKAIITP